MVAGGFLIHSHGSSTGGRAWIAGSDREPFIPGELACGAQIEREERLKRFGDPYQSKLSREVARVASHLRATLFVMLLISEYDGEISCHMRQQTYLGKLLPRPGIFSRDCRSPV